MVENDNVEIAIVNNFLSVSDTDVETMLNWYYYKLSQDNLVEQAFYDGSVRSKEDFINFALDKNVMFVLVFDRMTKLPIAHFHLTGFEGLLCRGHFCMTRTTHGRRKSVSIARTAASKFFKLRRIGSEYPSATCIIGLTPVTNRLACSFIQQVGFEPITTLDDACWIEKEQRYVPGLLTKLTPQQLAA